MTIENEKLNKKQLEAVSLNEGSFLITAGAGSGKTKVLTHRVSRLIKEGLASADSILAITFTNKAASEMKDRIKELVDFNFSFDIWVMTFHSMCVRILRENNNISKVEGYNKFFSIYDTTDKNRIIKDILKKDKLDSDENIKKISAIISGMKNSNMSIEDYSKDVGYALDSEFVINSVEEYEKYLVDNNALDFDSLLTVTYKIINENKDIREYYQNKFKYIHIDEFQDTNEVQYDLAKILAGKYKNIFAVGDEDQCIYTWRGANPENINRFHSDFEKVKIIKLEQNYRSTKKILEAANLLISHNKSRIDKELWTENDSGHKIEHKAPFNEKEEVFNVIREIKILTSRGYKYSDFAILMRMNSLTRNFEESLLEYNIPYRVFGGMKFYDRMEIKNIIAYIKVLYNNIDDNSLFRVINFPKRGIGNIAIQDFNDSKPEDMSAYEHLMQLDESSGLPKSPLSKFLKVKKLFLDLEDKKSNVGIKEFVEHLVRVTGILEMYESKNDEESLSRKNNILEYIKSVEEWENNNPQKGIADYLSSVTLITDIDTYDEDDNSVIISTVHSVKGLEFKNVFIVGVEEEIFPLRRQNQSEEEIEEERRLMYVAMTRAQEKLCISNAKQRYLYGTSRYMRPSRFLEEAGLIKNKYKDSFIEKFNSPIQGANYSHQNKTEAALRQTTSVEKQSVIDNIKTGSRVEHPKFGEGEVISISGSPKNRTATIQFDGLGKKTLALNFAPVKII